MKKALTFLLLSIIAISTFAGELMNEKRTIADKSFSIKVTEENTGKLKAIFQSEEDANVKMETFTNHITVIDFQSQLQKFVAQLFTDTLDVVKKAEINKVAIELYGKLPTEATAKGVEEASVVLHIKKTIPVQRSKNGAQVQTEYKRVIDDAVRQLVRDIDSTISENKGKPLVITESRRFQMTNDKGADVLKSGEISAKLNSLETSETWGFRPSKPYLGKFQLTEDITTALRGTVKLDWDSIARKKIENFIVGGPVVAGNIQVTFQDRSGLAFLNTLETELASGIHPAGKFDAFKILVVIDTFKVRHPEYWKVLNRGYSSNPIFGIGSNIDIYKERMDSFKFVFDPTFVDPGGSKLAAIKGANNLPGIYKAGNLLMEIRKGIESMPKQKRKAKKTERANYDYLERQYHAYLDEYIDTATFELIVDSVEMTFKGGFMQDVKVKGIFLGKKYLFENILPIGYSSKYNFIKVNKQELFENKVERPDAIQYRISLSDLFPMHDYSTDTETKDYSPDDQKVVAVINEEEKEIPLKRNTTKEIIDMRVFSDLFGIGKNAPNGLIQLEVGHRFKINTIKTQIRKTRSNFGGLEYIRLSGLVSKIENKQRELFLTTVDSLVNGKIAAASYAPFIDYYRHQSFHFAADMNLMIIGVPDGKSAFLVNGGVHYIGTLVKGQRSIIENGTIAARKDTFTDYVGSLIFQPEVKWEIAENQQIGGFLAYKTNFMLSLNRDYHYSNTQDFQSKNFGIFHTISGEFFYKPVNKDKLFLRTSFNWQQSLLKQHYVQVQVGYLINIFKKE